MDNFDFDKAASNLDEILNEKTRQYLVREGFPSDPASVALARSVIEKQILENVPKIVDMSAARAH